MTLPAASPDAFKEALDAFRRLVPMTDAEYGALSEELKPLAFTIANVSQADIVTAVYEAIDSAINNGDSFDTFKSNITDSLGSSWSEEDDAPSLETTFRTSVLQAYNDGRDEIISSDDVQESHPYLRYDAIEDGACTSKVCPDLNGTTLPQDDGFWDSHRPPMHFNCRCILTPLTGEDAARGGVTDTPPSAQADEGFGKRAETFEPDLSKYPQEIQDILRRRL